MASLEAVAKSTVEGLGFELVEVERAPRGLVRVFADRVGEESGRLSVDDCVTISHQLTRVFAVEGIDYDRLEVSSPGLDRPLKSLADCSRYVGRVAKFRLYEAVEGRKRLEGSMLRVDNEAVLVALVPSEAEMPRPKKKAPVGNQPAKGPEAKEIRVVFANVERARLVPDI